MTVRLVQRERYWYGSGMHTKQAAELAGMTVSAFRGAMTRERQRGNDMRQPPDEWPDKRTPTYDPAAVKAWAESRRK